MIYKHQEKEVELSKVTRLYPAVSVKSGGETAQVSLEWANSKADEIEILSFVLVFDIDPMSEIPVNRIEMNFETIESLFGAMHEVSNLLEK